MKKYSSQAQIKCKRLLNKNAQPVRKITYKKHKITF